MGTITNINNIMVTTIPTTNASMMVTEEERLDYLAELQRETTIIMIPAMSFLLLLAVTGLVGNCLVLFVYSNKFTRTSTRIFIMTIAAFDLVANVWCIPVEIYDMFHIWDFTNAAFCKVRLLVAAFSTLSSAMSLLAVAVVRYRKVCVPYGWQVTVKQARYISLAIAGLGAIFSLPYVIINGIQTKDTPRDDIQGHECTTDDKYVDTIWPLLNNSFFFILFVFCCIPLVILYVRIGIQAYRHSKVYGASNASLATMRTCVNSSSEERMGNTSSEETPRPEKNEERRNKDKSKTVESVGVWSITDEERRKEQRSKSIESVGFWSITDGERRKEQRSKSIESVGFGSITDVMDEYDEEIKKSDNPEEYGIRILDDSVEVSTPIIGNFTIQLQDDIVTDSTDSCHLHQSENSEIVAGKSESYLQGNRTNDVMNRRRQSQSDCKHVNNVDIDSKVEDNDENKDDVSECAGNAHIEQNNRIFLQRKGETYLGNNCGDSNDHRTGKLGHLQESTTVAEIPVHHIYDQDIHHDWSDNKENLAPELSWSDKQIKIEQTSRGSIVSHLDTENCLLEHGVVSSLVSSLHNGVSGIKGSDRPGPSLELGQTPEQGYLSAVSPTEVETDTKCRQRKTQFAESQLDLDILTEITTVEEADRGEHATKDDNDCVFETGEKPRSSSENDKDRSIGKVRVQFDGSEKENYQEDLNVKTKGVKRVSIDVLSTALRRRSKVKSLKRSQRRRPLGRTTAMLIIISAIFCVAFLPYIALSFFKFAAPEKHRNMTRVQSMVFNLFLRAFFLNCAANPIIYSICDNNFRRECAAIFRCKRKTDNVR